MRMIVSKTFSDQLAGQWLILVSMLLSNSWQASLKGCISSAFLMASLALKQFSCMYRHTAMLQCASSQPSFSFSAFQQLQIAFSNMEMLKQASPRFLKRQSFYRWRRQPSSTTMDSEQRPRTLREAALLLDKIIDSSQGLLRLQSFSSILLQSLRQSMGRPSSRYRQLRYSAAERLFYDWVMEDSRQVTASLALQARDLRRRANDFSSLSVSSTLFSFLPLSRLVPASIMRLLFLRRGESQSFMSCFYFISLGVGTTITFYSSSPLDLAGAALSSAGSMVKARVMTPWPSYSSRSLRDLEDSLLLSLMFWESAFLSRLGPGISSILGLTLQKLLSKLLSKLFSNEFSFLVVLVTAYLMLAESLRLGYFWPF